MQTRLTGKVVVAALLSLMTTTLSASAIAHASPARPAVSVYCQGSYCYYEDVGTSGTGAHGTGVFITLPGTVLLGNQSFDAVAAQAWLFSDQYTAIETGLVIGDSIPCGYEPYFHPYATLNNGSWEEDNCTYQASGNTKYEVESYVNQSVGWSWFFNQYGTPTWDVNWGGYNITGKNETMNEVHGYTTSDHPSWGPGAIVYTGEEWYDGTHWNSWGYTNTTDACPYKATWLSSTSWNSKSLAC